MSNLVEIKELGKCYGKKKVMNNLSLSLESGRIVGILGSNGSGKSTLIKMMAGVLKPTSGQITINGYPVGVNTKMYPIGRENVTKVKQQWLNKRLL